MMTTLNLTTSSPKCSPSQSVNKVMMKLFVFHVSEIALSYGRCSNRKRKTLSLTRRSDPFYLLTTLLFYTRLPTVPLCQVATGQRLFPPRLYLNSIDLHVLLHSDQQLVACSLKFREVRKLIARCSERSRRLSSGKISRVFVWCSYVRNEISSCSYGNRKCS